MSSADADNLARELHRRATRLTELHAKPDSPTTTITHVHGEVIGLCGALGILLGGTVQGGTADTRGADYYQQWLKRQPPAG
ncbi:hypothetical protein ABZX39_33530 [Streptomyces collinus]|uniref:hypothetical protein n=1 Tax=Streptomyces collinus TaxID=42684 RepID=UPI0033A4C9B1